MIIKIKRHIAVDFFNSFTLDLKYDSVASAFSFDYYFDPKNSGHRKAFNPGHFHTCDIEHDGKLLLRGTLLVPTFSSASTKQLSSYAGYSLPGVLEDCQIPTSLYPLQSDGKTLREIAQRLIQPFGLSMSVDPSVAGKMDQVYDTSTASESSSVKEYLSSLASQKNIILSHTADGRLLFTKAKTNGRSLFNFTAQNIGNTQMGISYAGQGMHSRITVQKQASIDTDNASEGSVANPFVPYTFRPAVKSQNSGSDNSSTDAARNMLAAELKGIKLTIDLSDWYLNGQLITPNNVISVQNDELFLYKPTKWFIESVSLTEDKGARSATLTCVLPEVYNGENPKNIFELH